MKRLFCLLLSVLLSAICTSQASAALVLHWQMNTPTPLDDSVGTEDLVLPGGANNPTHLPAGGQSSTGAYDFDGTAKWLDIVGGDTTIGPVASDWTASFWIKTTDAGTSSPYNGTPHVSVLGDQTGAIGFALGVHGGVAAFRHYNGVGPFGGWWQSDGTVNVANGVGHYVTFVHHNAGDLVDIYIDGLPDTLGLAAGDAGGSPYIVRDVGRSYNGGLGQFTVFTLDDVRFYNTALSAAEIEDAFALQVPEPSTCVLLGLGVIGLAVHRRRRTR